jgi:hypothetical protein
VTVAVPLPTVTVCVHEVSGVEDVEATSVAGPTPDIVTASDMVPGWRLNELPWTPRICTEQSSLTAMALPL